MDRSKWRLLALYLVVVLLLGGLGYGFQHLVRQELWNQAMVSIDEASEQGRNVLRVHLEESEGALNRMKARIEGAKDAKTLHSLVDSLERARWDTRIYMRDGTLFPGNAEWDGSAFAAFTDRSTFGLVEPHHHSSTGTEVFDMYLPFTLQDGSRGYLVREFPVNLVMQNFTLSFYGGRGYAYIINRRGDILLHEDHAGEHISRGNLFPYLSPAEDHPGGVEVFQEALALGRSGSTVMNLEGRTVWFGYRPLDDGSSWYLVTVVPMAVLMEESNRILSASALLTGVISLTLLALLALTIRHRRLSNQAVADQKNYSAHIFNHVTEGIALLGYGAALSHPQNESGGAENPGHPFGYVGGRGNLPTYL